VLLFSMMLPQIILDTLACQSIILMQMTKMLWTAKTGWSLLAEINPPPNYKWSSCKLGALLLVVFVGSTAWIRKVSRVIKLAADGIHSQQFAWAKMGEEIEELENTPRNKHTHLDTQRSYNKSPNKNNNQNTHTHRDHRRSCKSSPNNNNNNNNSNKVVRERERERAVGKDWWE
jgi:hypothetical protein